MNRMQVLFESSSVDGALAYAVARRRAGSLMRRLDWFVPGVRIALSEVQSARAGLDKRCHVEVRTLSSVRIVSQALAGTWSGAIDLALRRAARMLSRVWRRLQATQRPVLPHNPYGH